MELSKLSLTVIAVTDACKAVQNLQREQDVVPSLSKALSMLCEMYKESFLFRACFDKFFPPGSMILNNNQEMSESAEKLVFLYFSLIALICKRFGITERERNRFVETRNFLNAHIMLNFSEKHIIEIGGLQVPFIIRCLNLKSYTVSVNSIYARMHHSSHGQLRINSNWGCPVSYYEKNFEDIAIPAESSSDNTIIYSSNSIEHIQDLELVLKIIHQYPENSLTYFIYGPIRSHSFYGHHSSYQLSEIPLNQDEIDCFHLLPQSEQYRLAKQAFNRLDIKITDQGILDLLASSNISSRQMLNNLTYSDYLRIFHSSNLYIARLDGLRDLSVQNKANVKKLYAHYPSIGDITLRNMRVILTKQLISFIKEYPHLSDQIDPGQTHWLQTIEMR